MEPLESSGERFLLFNEGQSDQTVGGRRDLRGELPADAAGTFLPAGQAESVVAVIGNHAKASVVVAVFENPCVVPAIAEVLLARQRHVGFVQSFNHADPVSRPARMAEVGFPGRRIRREGLILRQGNPQGCFWGIK